MPNSVVESVSCLKSSVCLVVHLLCVCVYVCLLVGSPFHVNVIDPSKASARGDGLDMVQCNQMTSFFVCAPAAHLKDFDIKIIGTNSSSSNCDDDDDDDDDNDDDDSNNNITIIIIIIMIMDQCIMQR